MRLRRRREAVKAIRYNGHGMSYTLTLDCGCTVYVSAALTGSMIPTRVLQSRDPDCRVEGHRVGVRIWLWELLPQAVRVSDRRRLPRIAAPS